MKVIAVIDVAERAYFSPESQTPTPLAAPMLVLTSDETIVPGGTSRELLD